jgi:hypothetical protein
MKTKTNTPATETTNNNVAPTAAPSPSLEGKVNTTPTPTPSTNSLIEKLKEINNLKDALITERTGLLARIEEINEALGEKKKEYKKRGPKTKAEKAAILAAQAAKPEFVPTIVGAETSENPSKEIEVQQVVA